MSWSSSTNFHRDQRTAGSIQLHVLKNCVTWIPGIFGISDTICVLNQIPSDSRLEERNGATYPVPPFPITATRFPTRSTEESHREEWNMLPLKVPIPGIFGIRGM